MWNFFLSLFFTSLKNWFKINDKQRTIRSDKHEYVKFQNLERKIKSLFIVYEDPESILVPEKNGKQNPKEN